MRKLYANIIRSLAVIALFAISAQVNAATINGTITNGTELELDRKNPGNGVWLIAPETDCSLSITTNSWVYYAGHSGSSVLYTSENHELDDTAQIDERVPVASVVHGKNGYVYNYYLTGGKKYYFWVGFGLYLEDVPGNPRFVTFKFDMKDGIDPPYIVSVTPAPYTTYNLTEMPVMQIQFNQWGSIQRKTISLNYETDNGEMQSISVGDYIPDTSTLPYYGIRVKSAIDQVKKEMKDGSQFSIVISGLEIKPTGSNKYEPIEGPYVNDAGDVVLTYSYSRLTGIESVQYPVPFKSYWPEGDPNGVLKIVFDAPLLPLDSYDKKKPDNAASFTIFAGPYREPSGDDDSNSGWPTLPGAQMVIEDNVLTVDLTGVRRPAPDNKYVLDVLEADPIVSIWIQNLLDADGDPIDFSWQDPLKPAYQYEGPLVQINDIAYKWLPEIEPVAEFELQGAANINDATEVMVWVSTETAQTIAINGFEYLMGNEILAEIALDDVKVEQVSDGTEYYVPIPQVVKETEGDIVLSAKTSSDDGWVYTISNAQLPFASNGTNAVDAIGVEKGETVIYNLQGVRVQTSLENLPAGIYIVNGKKIAK